MLLTLTTSAQTPITYVDATHGAGGNTTLTNGSQWDPLASQSFVSNDGVWEARAFGNGATIYQNAASGGMDDAHPLLTTISGLQLNTYDVYVYFWSDSSSWRINAGLTPGSLSYFQFNPLSPGASTYATPTGSTIFSTSLNPNPFTSSVMIAEGSNRQLVQGYLGQVTGASISVFIEDGPAGNQDQRTWYDGIGYAIVPEPTAGALLGLGLLSLVFRRRNH
jgi:hypothetical protein